MHKKVDLHGKRFGRLTVIGLATNVNKYGIYWYCNKAALANKEKR